MRAIKVIKDTILGKPFRPDQQITNQKSGFEFRNQYKENPDRFECLECGQKLLAANSSNDNVYFRHFANSEDCLLKDEDADPEILEEHTKFLYARESERHKELKAQIGKSLSSTDGVDRDSIVVDSKFIIKDGEKRKPDVYCRFLDHELVFEIQLSPLSPRFIHHRLQFYRKHGIYVIWVIDIKGSPYLLSNMQRDIKYLFDSQHLFSLDEGTQSLQLLCNYKTSFLYQAGEIRDKWTTSKVALGELKFNKANSEVLFYDYICEKKWLEEKVRETAIEEAKNERLQKLKTLTAKISLHWKKDYNCYGLAKELALLSRPDTEQLNVLIKMEGHHHQKPLLCHYISQYRDITSEYKTNFIEFLLGQDKIRLKVNDKDPKGAGALVELYMNPDLGPKQYKLIPLLFGKGYQLTAYDRSFLLEHPELYEDRPEIELLKLGYYNSLGAGAEDQVRPNLKYLLFIESALQSKIIGSNVKSWVQLMMPILSGYKQYWSYTKTVLKVTGLDRIIAQVDAQGTIQKKIALYQLEDTEQDQDFYHVLYQLYPEIFLR